MSRKYLDDPAWQVPSRHHAVDTLLIILACIGVIVVGVALCFLMVLLIYGDA